MLKKKRLALIAIIISSFMVLTACSSIDPSSYVVNQLDALFKAEFEAASEDTGDSVERYQQEREEMLNAFVHEVEREVGLALTDEHRESLMDAFDSLLRQAQYEVVSHERVDDNYEVTLRIRPIMNLLEANENMDEAEMEAAMLAYFLDRGFDLENPDGTEDLEELMALVVDFTIDTMIAVLEDVSHGEEEEITVTVIRDTDERVIYMSEPELERLTLAIMPVQ